MESYQRNQALKRRFVTYWGRKRKLWEGGKRGTLFYSRDAGLAPGTTRVKEELSWKDSASQGASHELQESNSGPSQKN